MNAILEQIQMNGIIPVVKIDRADDAVDLAKALIEGGIRCIEVTFRTDAAKDAISRIVDAYPDLLVGAGTITTIQQVNDALLAGAKFLVSPGINPEIVRYSLSHNALIIPGCANASDIETALSLGLDTVKFFPSELLGGLPMIKALAAPYVNVSFIPTGGINESNFLSYLDDPKIVAIGGSWMVSPELINEKRFDEIRALSHKAVMTMLGFDLAHIGINESSEAAALEASHQMSHWFGFEMKPGNSSVFIASKSGSIVEFMKTPYLGDHGHLAIKTNSIERAVVYLSRLGVTFDASTKKYNAKGKLAAVYLTHELSGFAVHLVQK